MELMEPVFSDVSLFIFKIQIFKLSIIPGMPPPPSPLSLNSNGMKCNVVQGSRSIFNCSRNMSSKPPPPPPIRRSSSITSQDSLSTFRTSTHNMMSNEDEDVTPHGSMENVNVSSSTTTPTSQDRLSLEAMVAKASNVASNLIHLENNGANNNTMRRSTSLSTKAEKPAQVNSGQQTFDREQFLRKSLTLTSKADRANLINTLTERISQRMQQQQLSNNVTVIPVNGSENGKQTASVPSPEGEKYGFGAKFKQSSKQYFDMSASYPNNSMMTLENQKFIDNLSSKLMPSPLTSADSAATSGAGDKNGGQQQKAAVTKLASASTTHYV